MTLAAYSRAMASSKGKPVTAKPDAAGRVSGSGGASPPTLYLIDGYAQFFRAYHAIRTPMSSPVTKEPTNMTFGFVGMLLKLLRGGAAGGIAGAAQAAANAATGSSASKMERPPEFLAVAIDVSGDKETFRSTIDPEYKANRPPPPEDLFPQVDRCLAMLRTLGVPVVGLEGYEADDAIATIVTRLRRERPDVRIRIVSKDKDLKQLLEPGRVELYDVHNDVLIDAAALKAETGLEPAQVIDMLALMGDTVDNVKGVDGVGPKTAAELIATYGTLENLIKHAGEVKGKRGEALRAAAHRLPTNIKLVSLVHDTPIDFDLSSAATERIKLAELIPILRELGFNRYQDEVKALLGEPVTERDLAAEAAMNQVRGAGSGAGWGGAASGGAGAVGGEGKSSQAKAAVPSRRRATAADQGPGLFGDIAAASGAEPGGSSLDARPANPEYRCVRTPRELEGLVKSLRAAEVFAFDTETTSLHPRDAQLCGLSFATVAGGGWYVPVRSPDLSSHMDEATVLAALRPILEDAARPKCGHNLKYDLMVLRNAGVTLRGIAFDSMIASYVIDASRSSHGLDALALALLNHTNISIKELIGSGPNQRSFASVPVDKATQYAAEDADIALRLREVMLPQLRATGLVDLFVSVEMPLLEVLAELEWNGILVDPAELDRQRSRLELRIKELRNQIDDAAYAALGRTFNPDSPKQLAVALFNKKGDGEPGLGLRAVKKTKTGKSTDIEVLETLAEDASITTPIPRLIVDYRQLTKLVSTYLVALKDAINPKTGRIHASFNQTVAVTGRLASSDPNLQNIPIRTDVGREIRRAFIAPGPVRPAGEGLGAGGTTASKQAAAEPSRVFIAADYSQIELRLLAHLSQDPALIQAFHEGQDIHTAVAAQINKVPIERVTKDQRAGAKMVNFGIVYGITAFGLARRLGIANDEAAGIITAYKRRFAGITTFLQECIEQARRHGYVETILKRRRPIPDIESNIPARRAFAERTAINSVVQGSAADLIKLAMLNIYRMLPSGAASGKVAPELRDVLMLLQIHDELVFEAPEKSAAAAQQVIVHQMEHAMELTVPLKVDSSIATNWFDGK